MDRGVHLMYMAHEPSSTGQDSPASSPMEGETLIPLESCESNILRPHPIAWLQQELNIDALADAQMAQQPSEYERGYADGRAKALSEVKEMLASWKQPGQGSTDL